MKRAIACAAIAVALTACGASGKGGISPSASAELHAGVQQLRAAAVAGDRAAVAGKLAELRARVADLRGQGQLTDAGAQRILAAANDVEHNLDLIPPTIPPTTIAATTTAPPKKQKKGGGGDEGGD